MNDCLKLKTQMENHPSSAQSSRLVSPASGRWGREGGITSEHSCLSDPKVSISWSWGGEPLRERRLTGWDKKIKEN